MEQAHRDEMTVSDFLHSFAVPSFEAFCALEEEIAASVAPSELAHHDPRFVRLRLAGATAAVWVFHVLDWHWQARKGTPVCLGETDWKRFKKEFFARNPQVEATSDIADAAKHCTLDKVSRHPPRFDLVRMGSIEHKWDDPGINWDDGNYWDAAPCLVAYDAAGKAKEVRPVLQSTINLWLAMERNGTL